jgi:two-component system nitrogen regulation response regulator GlnG
VLVCGESGTGKELVAHAIHRQNARLTHLLLSLRAIPENLLESELLDMERCFTGAYTQKRQIRTGAYSTLFLDEIGELVLIKV